MSGKNRCAVKGCRRESVDVFGWDRFTLILLCQAHADRLGAIRSPRSHVTIPGFSTQRDR